MLQSMGSQKVRYDLATKQEAYPAEPSINQNHFFLSQLTCQGSPQKATGVS